MCVLCGTVADRRGVWLAGEFLAGFAAIEPKAAAAKSKQELVMLFRQLDKDGSEAIGFEEFCVWMAREHCERMPAAAGGKRRGVRGRVDCGSPRRRRSRTPRQQRSRSPGREGKRQQHSDMMRRSALLSFISREGLSHLCCGQAAPQCPPARRSGRSPAEPTTSTCVAVGRGIRP